MKFNFQLAASFFLGATVATSVLFLSPLKAQSSNTLPGQCSGNTLMVSSGTGGNGDGEPYTGVCNKI